MKQTPLLITVLFVFLCVNNLSAQGKWGSHSHDVGLRLGGIMGKKSGFAAALTLDDFQSGCIGYVMKGVHLGTEYYPKLRNHPEFAIQTGVHLQGMGLMLAMSEVNYFREGKVDMRFRPEIGIDIFTFLTVSYGFSGHFLGEKMNNIAPHQLFVRINIRYSFWKDKPFIHQAPLEYNSDNQ